VAVLPTPRLFSSFADIQVSRMVVMWNPQLAKERHELR
jgi:hypothetical protein